MNGEQIVSEIKEISGYELRRTCYACPEQYDVYYKGNQVGYLRLRHGVFTAESPCCGGKQVYSGSPKGDGIFDDDERDKYLQDAIESIEEWRRNSQTNQSQ